MSSEPTPKKSRAGATTLLSILTALCVILLAVFFYTQKEKYDAKLAKLASNQTIIAQQTAQNIANISNNTTLLMHKLSTIEHTIAQELPSYDIRLLKARFCLEMAALNARYSVDTQTTAKFLDIATTIIEPLHEACLINVRMAIARDIASVNKQDEITHALTKLIAIELELDKLTINTTASKIQRTINQKPYEQSILAKLKQIIIITHHEEIPKLPLSSNSEAILKANLKLELTMIKWALIERQADIYMQSIHVLQQDLIHLFQNNNNIQAIIQQLESLAQVTFNNEVTDITSLTAIESCISGEDNK